MDQLRIPSGVKEFCKRNAGAMVVAVSVFIFVLLTLIGMVYLTNLTYDLKLDDKSPDDNRMYQVQASTDHINLSRLAVVISWVSLTIVAFGVLYLLVRGKMSLFTQEGC